MASYIMLGKFTAQGLGTLKSMRERLDAAKKIARDAGGNLTPYMTMGEYDIVGILAAPDDETAARIVIDIAMRGNVTTQTLRAFSEDEIYRLVEGLP